ncbi:pyridoxamine 5'-phosphate oxidase family protein [soil metagenome]
MPHATPSSPGFVGAMRTTKELADHYRPPSTVVRAKAIGHLDGGCRDFIARSTFCVVATTSTAGQLDVSPRGGPAGFVTVLDDHRLALPDLNGNNRLDSLRNIIETGRIAMFFVVPGLGETLRVNGAAVVTDDDEVLDGFTAELRRPATAIGVTVDEAFVHCAKAFRRGGIWDPSSWPPSDDRPSPSAILIGHAGLDGVTAPDVDASLEATYAADLAADRR